MVEWARLESECTVIPYRGFESLSLRHYFININYLRLNCRGTPHPTPHQLFTADYDLWGPDKDILNTLDPKEAIVFQVINYSVAVSRMSHDRDLQSHLLRNRSLFILFIFNNARALARRICQCIKA